MTNHPNRSRIDPDTRTLETVKSYIARIVWDQQSSLTLADAIEEADVGGDDQLLGFEVETHTVSKYLRESGEYERCTVVAGERDFPHLAVVVAIVDLGGHYGVTRNAVAYFEWAKRARAVTLAKRLNKKAATESSIT